MGDEQLPAHLMNTLSRSLFSSSGDGAFEDNGSPLPLSITPSPLNHKRSSSLSTITTVTDPSSASSSTVNDDRRLMTRAINEGDLDEVRRLLAAGCDPNAVFVKLSMLQYATLHEDVEMMQLLLDYEADPCFVSQDGICALHIAVSSCYLECTKLLVKRGADVEYAPKDRCPPLFVAIMAGDRDAIAVLLEAGADPNRTVVGKTPLMIAVEAAKDAPPKAMAALLKQLVNAGARLEEESDNAGTVLHFAASQNSASAVDALLSLGADPNARGPDGITPLETALRYHHADAALALLALDVIVISCSGGADPNIFKDPLQPLLHSCLECKRSTELVSAMLAAGADARLMHGRNPGLSTLEFAILRGSPETVAALLRYFPVQTTIAAAIFALRVEHSTTRELQDACIQIGHHLAVAGYSFRRAPPVVLQWAARAGKDEFIHALLKAGMSPDTMDHFGRTPLYWLSICLNTNAGAATVRTLVKLGANPNAGKLSGPIRDDA